MRPVTRTEHGQYGYQRKTGCTCEPCTRAARAYMKRRAYDAARGVPRTVPAAPVRAHLQPMVDAQISYVQLSKATGGKVTPSQIRRLMTVNAYGKPVEKMYRATAEALLAIRYFQASEQAFAYVSPIPTRRRIEALRWMGWPVSVMADHLGVADTSVYHYVYSDRITTRTEQTIERLYREWYCKRGPSDQERFTAYRRGYLPPAAWDDQALSDPYGLPQIDGLACVVCGEQVHANSMCQVHWQTVVDRDGFRSGRRFRGIVESLMRQQARAA